VIPVGMQGRLEAAKWLPDPETEATLQFLVKTLTTPEADGLCMVERVYLTCQYENQRCEEIQTAAIAFLGKRFKDKAAFFQADLPDDGRCRFQLRLADHFNDLEDAQPAKQDWFLNLLKPKEEWIRAPGTELVLEKPPEPAPTQKPESRQGKAIPPGMRANLAKGGKK
jgi:hypothetical protein